MENKKMSKREIFLSDIIITAVEGGIGYWSLCSKYDHGYNGEGLDEEGRTPAKAVILEEEEDGDTKYVVDTKLVAKAFRRIMGKGEIPHTSKDNHGDDWPDPEIPTQEHMGRMKRSRQRRFGPRHISCLTRTVNRLIDAGSTENIERIHKAIPDSSVLLPAFHWGCLCLNVRADFRILT